MITGSTHSNAREALADIDFYVSEMEQVFSERKDRAARAAEAKEKE